jgi:hypothetical protein
MLAVALVSCGGDESDIALPDIPMDSNLVVNPSFEEWENRIPVGWEMKVFEGWGGEKPNRIEKSTKERSSGKASVFIRGVFNNDKWYVLTQRHPVVHGYRVEFSADIMSQNIKQNQDQPKRANIYIRFLDENGERLSDRYYADAYTRHRKGTTIWRRSKERADVPKNAKYVEIGLINQMTGYLYFDDVELKLTRTTKWKKKKSKYVHYNYIKGFPPPEGSIEKQAKLMEDYAKKLDLDVEEPFNYFYYPTEDKFKKITGLHRYRQRALWKKREIHTIAPTEDLESTHMLLVDYGRPPLAMTTGIVYTLLGSMNGKDIHGTAKGFLMQQRIPALFRTIPDEEFKNYNTSITAPAWASFCSFMLDTYGAEMVMEFYRRTDQVTEINTFKVRFKEIFGTDFEIIDRKWRLYLLRLVTEGESDTIQ